MYYIKEWCPVNEDLPIMKPKSRYSSNCELLLNTGDVIIGKYCEETDKWVGFANQPLCLANGIEILAWRHI